MFENLNQLRTADFQPISTFNSSTFSLGDRLNFDGYAVYDLVGDKSSCSYTQVFRNAVVEAVDACTFYAPHDKILFQVYERYIVKALSLYCPSLITKFIDGPCVVFLSILGIKGYEIKPAGTILHDRINKTPIERENLLLPDMYIEDINNFSAPEIMKPAFDMVWNACGYSGSKNYNKRWAMDFFLKRKKQKISSLFISRNFPLAIAPEYYLLLSIANSNPSDPLVTYKLFSEKQHKVEIDF